ncbi:MAG: Imm57 family immunity protein [Burkholderiales bacterium]
MIVSACLRIAVPTIYLFAQIANAQIIETSPTGNSREIESAERFAIVEIVKNSSYSVRQMREKCGDICAEDGALELSIGLLGQIQNARATDVLINFLGFQFDGAVAEELDCQFLKRGKNILRRLKSLDAASISQHCRTLFLSARERELAAVVDVPIERICAVPPKILAHRDHLIEAIKQKVGCQF